MKSIDKIVEYSYDELKYQKDFKIKKFLLVRSSPFYLRTFSCTRDNNLHHILITVYMFKKLCCEKEKNKF